MSPRVAVLEQVPLGYWTAYIHLGYDIVIGCGDNQADAETDLRRSIGFLHRWLSCGGYPIPAAHAGPIVFEILGEGLTLTAQLSMTETGALNELQLRSGIVDTIAMRDEAYGSMSWTIQ